ncbi:hypothetical protein [Glycocaulis alkaliphilus]|uniref:hypothetical protein n=1 Tax=Glycocaulis alkaliphilus TaxID=1434191 RepID=UPI000FDC8924|nr:hypothetical protein [Glycocaulis alkaliphilus]GGB83737.1 hypothetical protein GCM10007417_24630 [Glycocaulis alkaliphilus]
MRGPWVIAACVPLLAGVLAGEAQAGAWTQKRGEGVLLTGYSTHWLTAPGGTQLRKSEISFYAEYGLVDRVTLVGRFALQSLSETRAAPDEVADTAFSNALVAVGGTEAGVRLRLLETGPWVLSAQLSRTFESGGENRNNQRFGTGGGDVETRLLAGRAFGRDGFADIQLARRSLAERGGEEWRFDSALGVPVSPRWRIITETFSVRASRQPGGPAYSGHRVQLSAVYDAPAGFSVSAGVLGTLQTDNSARERAAFTRLWRRF